METEQQINRLILYGQVQFTQSVKKLFYNLLNAF